MKPPPFEYRAPTSVEEALDLLWEHGDEARPLAGGQSLVPLMALRLARPSLLVDLAGVAGLDAIGSANGSVTVGAMVRERAAERSAEIAGSAPLLAAALPLIGHPAIRSRGTVGGSLSHADPAGELPAVALAAEAVMVARSHQGERTIPAADFFTGYFSTALAPDELLTEVRWPEAADGSGAAFEEVARRHGDFAMVGVAAMVSLEAGKITSARLALSGVSDTPVRAGDAEAALVGVAPGDEAFGEAAQLAAAALSPPSDLHGSSAYRRHVAGVLVRRALAVAVARAQGSR
ncbi:MAG TPA: xanthine dehydrogenase family protein subunit M [Acidimicrobiales bacterium]|nr:xanthine dehydrogenase family protein subunit M [Acidimicrobiales bacterium]